jgi:Skp family chaperone for outer membrane proteins
VLKVTKPRVFAVLAASFLAVCLLGTLAVAQGQGGAPPASAQRFGAEIALVDVQYVFKNLRVAKQYQTDLQADQERAVATLKNDADAIKKLQEQLNQFRAGSPEYEDLDKRIVGLQADLSAKRTVMVKEFRKQEAKMICRIYQQIQDEIDAWANANGVVAVLVFNREVMDPEKPETVQAGMLNQVLWHHKNLDISQYVLQNLERRAGPQTGGVNPAFPGRGPGPQR